MRIFENQEERNQYELESLLKLVNNQRSIYSISFNEDRKKLTYRLVYGLNDISEKTEATDTEPKKVFCTKCTAENKENSKFCSKCGEKIVQD